MRNGKASIFGMEQLMRVFVSFFVMALVLSISSSALAATLMVKDGSRGENVRKVQERLIEQGFLNDEADGVCGPVTVAAIKEFQKANGLEEDGVCGMATYSVLDPEDAEIIAAAPDPTEFDASKHHMNHPVWVEATAYSAYDPGNGPYTASGTLVRHGVIAVDTSFIPMGTRVFIPGYGEAVAEDIGWGIRGNIIDIAFDSHEEALMFGRRSMEIYILD